MLGLSVTNNNKRKIIKAGSATSSLGLVIPFQPCMQDEKTIQNMLKHTIEAIHTKLEGSADSAYANEMFTRLEKVFSELNYNSHRKSIVVILKPYEEKVIYLGFRAKPVTFFNKYVSVLELVANAGREPEFYLLLLQKNNAELYEYHNKQVHKVYTKKQEPGFDRINDSDCLIKQVLHTLKLVNSKNDKPVFVTGNAQLVSAFYNASPFPKLIFKKVQGFTGYTNDKIELLSAEITNKWNCWQSKLASGKIILAQKTNNLISYIEAVLQALRRSVDGLLLIDKRLKQQLYKSRRVNALFNKADELTDQVERFLARGNSIEITETGLLKDFGGIVLLQKNTSCISESLSADRHQAFNNTGSLF